MYAMFMSELAFRHDRLQDLMNKRGWNDGQVAYKAGVSKSMVFYLRKGERADLSATMAGRLAEIFGTSVEYLVGMTDDPAPVKMQLEAEIEELLRSARHLPRHRQRDLLRMAESFAKENDQDRMDTILDMVKDIGGEEAEDALVDLLRSLRSDNPALLGPDIAPDAE